MLIMVVGSILKTNVVIMMIIGRGRVQRSMSLTRDRLNNLTLLCRHFKLFQTMIKTCAFFVKKDKFKSKNICSFIGAIIIK